jgi:hypothetical protein
LHRKIQTVDNFFDNYEFLDVNDLLSPADDMSHAEETDEPKSKRRTVEVLELSERYLYRRAFSEVSLLDIMKHEKLTDGVSYNFISGGDVDSLSYLKVVLNQHSLDDLLLSTWCMAGEDIFQLRKWYEEGKIRHLDMYLGEIFPSSYKIEWAMVRRFYATYPDAGRVAVFRNHSKIYAGKNEADGFYFGIQSSANINTNPRTEQASITVDKGLYEFYKNYFDNIKSFV